MPSNENLHIHHDSGSPQSSEDPNYTTLILVHGFGWSSEVWKRLLPFAPSHNVRIVSVNRRDYPGATPYTDRDRALLQTAADATESSVALEALLTFMNERARELHDFLVEFVRSNKIPVARHEANAGGIVIVGWSLGAAWMTALLANVGSFPVGDVKLGDYIRRIVFLDPAYHSLGYPLPPPPADAWNPFMDYSLAPEDAMKAFAVWASGYFSHSSADSFEQLEIRKPLDSPPPTITTMSPEELAMIHMSECDSMLHHNALKCGVFGRLRKDALLLHGGQGSKEGNNLLLAAGDEWSTVEIRHVLCERSLWETHYGLFSLRAEIEENAKAGKAIRKVTYRRVPDANHFGLWEFPERTLHTFLA
ncbi:Alpha/Beta hydrolase protein [Fomes fomentarius]|nr:Alpha/Beta hydrolase protein [Fomes fomentarius]